MVVIKVDSVKVIAALEKAGEDLPKKIELALETVAALGAEIILDRTDQGRGIRGKFAPYSAKYAEAKRKGWPATKKRAKFSGDPTGVVNLQLHKQMLSSMQSKAKGNEGQIYFSNPFAAMKAAFNNKKRPFFGFNNPEIKEIVDKFTQVIVK